MAYPILAWRPPDLYVHFPHKSVATMLRCVSKPKLYVTGKMMRLRENCCDTMAVHYCAAVTSFHRPLPVAVRLSMLMASRPWTEPVVPRCIYQELYRPLFKKCCSATCSSNEPIATRWARWNLSQCKNASCQFISVWKTANMLHRIDDHSVTVLFVRTQMEIQGFSCVI